MPSAVNRVVLVGTIGRHGVEVRHHTSGTPYASFVLVYTEQTPGDKYFSTVIPCEVWGKKAEAAAECAPNQLVLFEGKLKKRQKGEQWELYVSGFEVTPITAAVPTMAGSN